MVEDFLSSSTQKSSESNDVEIIDICERTSKEFEMCAENLLPQRNEHASVTDLFTCDLPDSIVWTSVLSALEDAKDFDQLKKLCHDLKGFLPELKPRIHSFFSEKNDIADTVAQSEIPIDGPQHLKACRILGDGNCLCRALSRAFYNSDEFHIEI